MKYFLIILLHLVQAVSFAESEEVELLLKCKQGDLAVCESLSAYYVKTSKWENAHAIGEALCKKEIMKGCTFAGTAMLAQRKAKEGVTLLTKACDGFEPYACRSLGRLMKQNKEELAGYMYNKRACHYGLDESCKNLKAPKETYSAKGKEFLKKLFEDCDDSGSSLCQEKLNYIQDCSKVLTANDCLLIPGELSIYFRAKFIQKSAKVALLNLVSLQNENKTKQKRYSYDLKHLMKDGKGTFAYVFGFSKACTKKFETAKGAASTSLALFEEHYKDVSSRTKKNISSFFYKGKPADCYDPKFGYEAFAAANLDPQNVAKLDVWKINQDGNLIQLQDGLPVP